MTTAAAWRQRAVELVGIGRSLAIYHGIPGRAARLRRFYRQFVSPGDLCFDIGAHVGNHTRCWRRLGARVVALEPQPSLARLLRAVFSGDPKVTVLETAVGRTTGRALLNASARTPTVSSLSRAWIERVSADPSFAEVRWAPQCEVPVTTLAELIAHHGEPRFVKIDVEGFELEVLSGLDRPLQALSFEVLPVATDAALACIERVAQWDQYEFNWSLGEQYQWVEAHWCSAQSMRDRVSSLAAGSRSGDIYARRLAGG